MFYITYSKQEKIVYTYIIERYIENVGVIQEKIRSKKRFSKNH